MIGGPDTLDYAGLAAGGVISLVAWLCRKRLGLIAVALLTAFAGAASAYAGIRLMLSGDPADGLDLARYIQLVIFMKRSVACLPLAIGAAAAISWASRAWRRWRGHGRDASNTG